MQSVLKASKVRERLEYLRRVSVSVVASSEEDAVVAKEVLKSMRLREIRVFEASSNASRTDFKRAFIRTDAVLGGSDFQMQKISAEAASELGIPFVSWGVVTVILPDGFSFDEIEFETFLKELNALIRFDTLRGVLNGVVRSLQSLEIFKLFAGLGEPAFAPQALVPSLSLSRFELSVKKRRLRLKKDESG